MIIKSNYIKKILTNPGDAKTVLKNTAYTATKPFLKNVKTVFAVTNALFGTIHNVLT